MNWAAAGRINERMVALYNIIGGWVTRWYSHVRGAVCSTSSVYTQVLALHNCTRVFYPLALQGSRAPYHRTKSQYAVYRV